MGSMHSSLPRLLPFVLLVRCAVVCKQLRDGSWVGHSTARLLPKQDSGRHTRRGQEARFDGMVGEDSISDSTVQKLMVHYHRLW
jgi:hypothetical protein